MVVSDEAGAVLDVMKVEGGFKSLDNTMDHFLKSVKKEDVGVDESG